MLAKRAGDKVRWRVVVSLEMVKAILRLCMGRLSGKRPVIGSGIGHERQERRADDESGNSWDVEQNNSEDSPVAGNWQMPRTGMRLPPLPSSSGMDGETITAFLGKRVISADEIKSAQRLVRKITSVQGQIAELMWVLRPVVYALALQRCQTNRRDWRPWIIGLAMEVASRQLAKNEVEETVVGGTRGLSGVEREESRRRGWGMAWWGMRGAFYEHVSRKYILSVAEKLKGKPLLDMASVIIEDYDFLWDECYFSTATT